MRGNSVISWLRPTAKHVLDILLPPNCLACDTPVDAEGQFCLACFRKANFISGQQCGRCGVPLPFAAAAGQGASARYASPCPRPSPRHAPPCATTR